MWGVRCQFGEGKRCSGRKGEGESGKGKVGRGKGKGKGKGRTYATDDGVVVPEVGFAVLAAEDAVGV